MAKASFGSVSKQRSGRYRADYQDPRYPAAIGRRFRIAAPHTFTTKSAARAWLAKVSNQIQSGEWKSPEQLEAEAQEAARIAEADALTFAEFAEISLAARKDRHSTETHRKDLSNYNHWIKPYWGDKPIKAITPQDVTAWLNTFDLTRPGYKRPLELFSAMLNEAVKDFELLQVNPAERPIYRLRKSGKKHRATKSQRHEAAPLTLRELGLLADEIEPRDLRLWVLLGGLLGLRAGELRGLRRSSFDFEKGLLNITSAVTGAGEYLDLHATPKTATSVRTLPIPPGLEAEIKRHMEQFTGFDREAWLFPSPSNPEKPRGHSSPGVAMKKTCKTLKIAPRTSHDLRHSCASLLAEAGIPPVSIQTILGHAESSITRRYTHAYAEQTKTAITGLWDQLTSASGRDNLLQLPNQKGA